MVNKPSVRFELGHHIRVFPTDTIDWKYAMVCSLNFVTLHNYVQTLWTTNYTIKCTLKKC